LEKVNVNTVCTINRRTFNRINRINRINRRWLPLALALALSFALSFALAAF
jgi:hypothetical protein